MKYLWPLAVLLLNNLLFAQESENPLIPLSSFGQEQTISDGPYIFIEKNKLIEKKNNKQ